MCSNSARAEGARLSALVKLAQIKLPQSTKYILAAAFAGSATSAALADDRPLEPLEDPGACPIDAPVRVASVDSLRHFEGLIGHCEATAIIESPAYRANRPRLAPESRTIEPVPLLEERRPSDRDGASTRMAAKADDRTGDATDDGSQMRVSADGRRVGIVPPPSRLVPRPAPAEGANDMSADAEAILALRPQSYATAFDEHIAKAARTHGVDPLLLHAVIRQESNYRQRVVSHAGARGLMQVMPATGRMLGVANADDLFDSFTNIDAGARLIAQLWQTFDGDIDLVLASYNAGEGAVRRHGMRIPPYRETRDYVAKVKANYTLLASESGLAVTF